jgi:hypothetical protein
MPAGARIVGEMVDFVAGLEMAGEFPVLPAQIAGEQKRTFASACHELNSFHFSSR